MYRNRHADVSVHFKIPQSALLCDLGSEILMFIYVVSLFYQNNEKEFL